jgi:hypothetical protein
MEIQDWYHTQIESTKHTGTLRKERNNLAESSEGGACKESGTTKPRMNMRRLRTCTCTGCCIAVAQFTPLGWRVTRWHFWSTNFRRSHKLFIKLFIYLFSIYQIWTNGVGVCTTNCTWRWQLGGTRRARLPLCRLRVCAQPQLHHPRKSGVPQTQPPRQSPARQGTPTLMVPAHLHLVPMGHQPGCT